MTLRARNVSQPQSRTHATAHRRGFEGIVKSGLLLAFALESFVDYVIEQVEQTARKNNMIRSESKVILDSGAEISVFGKVHPEMENISTSVANTLVYGNNESVKVDNMADIGRLKNVRVCRKNADNILSLSQLTELGFNILMTDKGIYVLKHDQQIQLSRKNIVMVGEREGGLYTMSTVDLINYLKHGIKQPLDSDDDSDSEDDKMVASDEDAEIGEEDDEEMPTEDEL